MIRRNTWVLLIILAALVGFAFYLKDQKARSVAQATPTPGSMLLFNSSEGTPNDIKVADSTGTAVEVARNSSGTWALKAPTAAAADQGAAEAAATQVGDLRILSDVQLGPDVVGLDKPSYVITVVFSGGQTHKLTVGSVTPIQDGYYVQEDGGKIQIAEKQGLDSILGLIKTPPYAATATPAVSPTPTRQPDTPTPEDTITPPPAMATGAPTKSP
jgi:hypothetical protein